MLTGIDDSLYACLILEVIEQNQYILVRLRLPCVITLLINIGCIIEVTINRACDSDYVIEQIIAIVFIIQLLTCVNVLLLQIFNLIKIVILVNSRIGYCRDSLVFSVVAIDSVLICPVVFSLSHVNLRSGKSCIECSLLKFLEAFVNDSGETTVTLFRIERTTIYEVLNIGFLCTTCSST